MHDVEKPEQSEISIDLLFLPTQTIILKALEDKEIDEELKNLCLKVLIRIGLYTGNADILLKVAHQQY